jgi:hypothetical protein
MQLLFARSNNRQRYSHTHDDNIVLAFMFLFNNNFIPLRWKYFEKSLRNIHEVNISRRKLKFSRPEALRCNISLLRIFTTGKFFLREYSDRSKYFQNFARKKLS